MVEKLQQYAEQVNVFLYILLEYFLPHIFKVNTLLKYDVKLLFKIFVVICFSLYKFFVFAVNT